MSICECCWMIHQPCRNTLCSWQLCPLLLSNLRRWRNYTPNSRLFSYQEGRWNKIPGASQHVATVELDMIALFSCRRARCFKYKKLWFLCVPWGGERSRGAGDVRRSERACARRKGALQKYGSHTPVGATRGLPAVIAVFLAVRVGRRAEDF